MLNWLVVGRDHLQALTLILSLASTLLLLAMWRRGVLPWRVTVLPGLILAQLIGFYTYVLAVSPPPSEAVTTWSAAIRLETVASFFIMLSIYHWSRRGH